MADDKFDVIVVGAGPAGTAAALTLARAGLSVVLLERGEYAGAKNVQGAVLYTHMLDEIIPGFWKEPECPLERHITEQNFWFLSEDSACKAGFKSTGWRGEPHNCYTIIRTPFDRWFAKKAEEAGAQLYTGVTVMDVIKKDGRVAGIKTSEGDELLADVVIAADGVNSMLAQAAGLIDEWRSDEVALGVKEVLELPRGKIEDRFGLEGGEGATIEMFGDVSQGMLGYAFLYTNKESLSIGVGCKLSGFQKTGLKPYDLLDYVKQHPLVRKLIDGGKPLEYSGHLIPEGGYHSLPPLCADGFMVTGDAAQMINAAHREGSNMAMTSGRLAAETVLLAKKAGDYSVKTLSAYQKKLEASFIMPDLYDHRDLEPLVEKHLALFAEGPRLACELAREYFQVDGRAKHEMLMSLFNKAASNKALAASLKKESSLKNLLAAFKWGLPLALKFRKLHKQALKG